MTGRAQHSGSVARFLSPPPAAVKAALARRNPHALPQIDSGYLLIDAAQHTALSGRTAVPPMPRTDTTDTRAPQGNRI